LERQFVFEKILSGKWIGFVLRRRAPGDLFVALALLLAACNGTAGQPGQEPPASPSAAATPQATAGAVPAPDLATPSLPPGTYTNPVLDRDFPDPDVLPVGGNYYAYATNSGAANIQAARSPDLVHWEMVGEALPQLPDWAVQDFGWVWAPEVTAGAGGEEYLMYFTARFAIGQGGVQCIGLATSDSPAGPFQPLGEEPFICQTGEGGSIDAASFVDEGGARYLLWKNDGNSRGGQTWIYLQEVSADGRTLQGEPTRLVTADRPWEGGLVEGPTLWRQDGKYYLFYSANTFNSPDYAVGYAVAEDPRGPYEKAPEPLLKTVLPAGIVGPGGQDIVLDAEGETWLLFHGWTPEGYRSLNLAKLDWEGAVPRVAGLSRAPQPGP
jgi:beta-xylosidase